MSAMVALPKSSDPGQWSPEERALVEAAGLVHTDAQTGQKTLADRPVVAAFLQHCARTGLDPIARQIYSIARKSKGQLKWQIQISIDGARLVAERSGQYEGQTTPEFTADGTTWTQVWLSSEPPKAARVGVYRRGFREPLYAVALWDAYVQTKFDGSVSDMWKKMGPLMLAKCAEMLALRKAFPQDLSGLYSSEEMAQAETPAAPAQVEAVVVEPVVERVASQDWAKDILDVDTVDDLKAVYDMVEAAQEIGLPLASEHARSLEFVVKHFGLAAPPEGVKVGQLIGAVKKAILARPEPAVEPVEEPVDAEVVEEPESRFEESASQLGWDVAEIPAGDES